MIEELPSGVWILSDDTHISQWVKAHNSLACDPALFANMRPWLRDCKVVWDIGANIGDHTRFYLDIGMQVVAVEPNPEVFTCLEHNCPEAICLNVGASDEDGELDFAPNPNVGASRISAGGSLKIPVQILDNLELPAPDFIKIDVEGWEMHTLRGMRRTLVDHHPKMFVEVGRGALAANGVSAQDILDFMLSCGYKHPVIYPVSASAADEQFDWYFSE